MDKVIKMIEPKSSWHSFLDDTEKLAYMKEVGFVGKTADAPKQLVYDGFYGTGLCSLVGYQDLNCAIISFQDTLHCIDVDCLKDMQAGRADASLPEEYVVLDTETTGFSAKTNDMIELAAIKVRSGRQIDTFESLIATDQILPLDIQQLTGILLEDLADAPQAAEVIPKFADFIGNAPLVAHNAPFDMDFLKRYFSKAGLPLKNKVIDTLKLSRKAFPAMTSHKLSDLKAALNIKVEVSHRALPDVLATNELYRRCAEALITAGQPAAEPAAAAPTEKRRPSSRERSSTPTVHRNNVKISDVVPTVECFDCTHPFYQKNIVFTGELSLDRKEAMQRAVNAGAQVKSSVSGKTDYLVVGRQDLTLVGQDGMSSKEEKAQALNQSGKAHIKVISEHEFLALLCQGQEA